jgi:hypothetical protein
MQYSQLKNEETRVALVASWILNLDRDIWSLKSESISAEELAETYARFVVGHENEKI